VCRVTRSEDTMEVRIGKKKRANNPKKLTVVVCWLTVGQELDEKSSPILWTERPTGAVIGAGSLWPVVRTHCRFKVSRLVPLRRALPSAVCLSGLVALTGPASLRKPGTDLHWLSRRWRRRERQRERE
jgi:hypothetical protein